MAPISISLRTEALTSCRCRAGTTQNSAKAPSYSEPMARNASGFSGEGSAWLIGHITRAPTGGALTPVPWRTTRPQRSPPWMRGKRIAPAHPPASGSSALAYQPLRVLMSVAFTPAASTCTRVSPAPGAGAGMSSDQASLSGPPCPVRRTPRIRAGTDTMTSGPDPLVLRVPERPVLLHHRAEPLAVDLHLNRGSRHREIGPEHPQCDRGADPVAPGAGSRLADDLGAMPER